MNLLNFLNILVNNVQMRRMQNISLSLSSIKTFLMMMVALVIVNAAQATLSGTYTINPSASASSSNYTSFSDAVDDLINGTRSSGTATGPGVSGAVTFNVSNGTYYEQRVITPITGASNTNRITFQSASGDSSKVALMDTIVNSFANNYVVQLDGADFISFKKLTLAHYARSKSTTANYCKVVDIDDNADSNSFESCQILGAKMSSPTTYGALVYSVGSYPYTADSHNVFKNNLMRNGAMGFYWLGEYNVGEGGTVIEGNTIDSFYYMGVYTNYISNLVFKNNKVNNYKGAYDYGYGVYIYDYNTPVTAKFDLSNNKIAMEAGYAGMMLYYITTDSSMPLIISNNFIALRGVYSYYGIYSYESPYAEYVYNNINLTGSVSSSYALGIFGNSPLGVYVYNNNVVNLQTNGYTLYTSGSYITDEDYNNFYNPNTNTNKIYSGGNYSSLSAYQSASGFGANDIEATPRYNSWSDLHVASIAVNGKAKPLANYPTDIDGFTRNTTTPDIGADEFVPPATDAELTSIDSPMVGFCAGTKDVYVTLTNAGLATLSTASIKWSVGGTAQTTAYWSGTLASGSSASVKLGSFNFSSGSYTIVAEASSANGLSPDSNVKNNTKTIIRGPGMQGTYTIGGSSPDYSTISAAVADLNNRGVCNPTVFNIRDGAYNEQVELTDIGGASATNTITFQSQSKDSSKVRMYYAAGSTPNYLISLNGADYVTFRNMTLDRPGTSSQTGVVVQISNGANYNTIANNIMRSTQTGFPSSHIYSNGGLDSFNTIKNNSMKGGYYAIYMFGIFNNPENGNSIVNNTIDSFYYMATYFAYQSNATVNNNRVINPQYPYGYSYGMYLYMLEGKTRVMNNYIRIKNGGYGMLSYYMGGTSYSGSRTYNDSGLIS
jgi:hypothetical protein